ncbi:hypothetical protein ILUMI_08121 [Ignelater luminosus]|uniref:Fanconi anaemia group A protein N-terminal domain-containing protein n=1 Tax=Ignelater luminosus TaxID=2038154 RepID=A0A8K0D6P6_IGNLU|nr:hypothetical protein ILUMI_08121 [Ignelater luminosus]
MDYETLSENEETFSVDVYTQLKFLNNDDLIKLIKAAIINKNINDASLLTFQMFYNIMAVSIHNKILDQDYHELNEVIKLIKSLKEVNKFDCYIFIDCLLEEFLILPVEIVWWLHKNEIMYFSQYCDMLKPTNIANDLLQIIRSNKEHSIFITQEIMEDLLLELIQGYYRPNPGICRLQRSKAWSDFCFKTLNDLIEQTINIAINETNDTSFANVLQYMHNSKKFLPSVIIKQFYENILHKIMTHDVNQYDLYSSYVYQQLWCSKRITNSLLLIYQEIFEEYCGIQHILQIMNDYEDKINWRFTLAAVGVCIQKSPKGITDIKAISMQFLEESFKGGKLNYFIKAFLFIRQSCLESSLDDYRFWYSNTFGSNSTLKTISNVTLFKFVINTLISLIPYEPKLFLKLHINQGIAAPPKCNSLVFDYKNLCRARLEELKQTPSVLMNGIEIAVLHLAEESTKHNCVCPIMVDILRNRYEEFFNIILPQILRNKMPFTKVKQLLLNQQYITDDVIHFCQPDPDGKIFDEDEEDAFICKK